MSVSHQVNTTVTPILDGFHFLLDNSTGTFFLIMFKTIQYVGIYSGLFTPKRLVWYFLDDVTN